MGPALRVALLPEELRMNDSPPDALQRLVIERMRELRRSYGDVARLGKLPRSTVHHLAPHCHSGRWTGAVDGRLRRTNSAEQIG